MDRTSFFDTETHNGIKEYDLLTGDISKFKAYYPIQYYRIEEDDLVRPDLISYKVYGTVKFWWLLMAFNGIHDVFNEMVTGTLIKVPNLLDVYTFYKNYGVK